MDYIRSLAKAYDREQSHAAKDAIAQILINSRMCAEGHRPRRGSVHRAGRLGGRMCQHSPRPRAASVLDDGGVVTVPPGPAQGRHARQQAVCCRSEHGQLPTDRQTGTESDTVTTTFA